MDLSYYHVMVKVQMLRNYLWMSKERGLCGVYPWCLDHQGLEPHINLLGKALTKVERTQKWPKTDTMLSGIILQYSASSCEGKNQSPSLTNFTIPFLNYLLCFSKLLLSPALSVTTTMFRNPMETRPLCQQKAFTPPLAYYKYANQWYIFLHASWITSPRVLVIYF